jgi:tetratricopeptide (TPR) repeat protein
MRALKRDPVEGPVVQALSPDREHITVVSQGRICVQDLRDEQKTKAFAADVSVDRLSLVLSWDNKYIATSSREATTGGPKNVIRVWALDEGKELFRSQIAAEYGGMALSPDGRYLAFTDEMGLISVWDVARRTKVKTYKLGKVSEGSAAYAVAFSPDGSSLGVCDTNDVIRVWGTQSDTERLKVQTSGTDTLEFSRDGDRLLSSDWLGRIELWDVKSGRKISQCVVMGRLTAMDMDLSCERIVAASGGTIQVWDASTGTEIISLNANARVDTVGFSPDAKSIIAGCNDGTIRIWDSESRDLAADAADWYARGIRNYNQNNQSSYDLAVSAFTATIAIDPKNYDSYRYRGLVYAARGEFGKAIEDLEIAMKLAPEGIRRLRIMQDMADVYDKANRPDAVERQYRELLTVLQKQPPTDDEMTLETMSKLAKFYAEQRQHEKARAMYSTMLETYAKSRGDSSPWTYASNLPEFYESNGQYAHAKETWLLLAQGNPPTRDTALAMNCAAWTCATCPDDKVRNGKEAVEYATKACELNEWKNADWMDTLAAAHAEAGDFKAAVDWQGKAIGLLSRDASQHGEFEARLKLYQDGKPYREEPRDTPAGQP